jgi:hypothetical protein
MNSNWVSQNIPRPSKTNEAGNMYAHHGERHDIGLIPCALFIALDLPFRFSFLFI